MSYDFKPKSRRVTKTVTSRVRHDIKSHVTVIKLFVTVLRKKLPQTKESKTYLDKINERAEAIVQKIEELS
ncbi:hypothetical protein C4564_01610 [Candidatus Microgenomates bacterium]|nr:MAG: hypothetical protein C4564_01610 [Candidatus Microgenomates bacterium]